MIFLLPIFFYVIVELSFIVVISFFSQNKGIGHSVCNVTNHLIPPQSHIQAGMGGYFPVYFVFIT